MKLKIAIVSFILRWQGGGTRVVYSLARALTNSGHQVVIYAPEFDSQAFPELQKDLDIRIVESGDRFALSESPKGILSKIRHKLTQERLYIDAARRIAKAMDPDFDVINLHDSAYLISYFYKKINPNVKVICTAHDPPYTYLPKANSLLDILSRFYNRFKDWTSSKYFKHIDKVTVLDVYDQKWWEARGVEAAIVRPGVDFDNFYAPLRDFSYKAKNKSVQLMGLGVLGRHRRFEDIILAVKKLREEGCNARAVIICNDIGNDSEYRRYLLELTQSQQLESYIDFRFSGASNEELRKVYEESDVFILPLLPLYLPPPRDGYCWGLVNFEAMAAGLPVVICRTSGACEALQDGENALFVDPMNPYQIATKIRMLVDNPQLHHRIAESGQKFVKENLTWEKYAKDMIDALRT